MAKKNGILERNGHTEATVDLMRLAGLPECGLCCEIMREDGTMMRVGRIICDGRTMGSGDDYHIKQLAGVPQKT